MNTSSSPFPPFLKGASRALAGIAILAALAVGLLLSSVGPLQAQGDSTIEYAENGEGPVAVFTATDPELAGAVTWSLATDGDAGDAGDAEDFKIDKASGVLTFAEVPNYEMAADGDGNNEYSVTVVATDADDVPTNKVVTVTVTNVDEAGTVTLSPVAPYPGVDLTATHSDLDGGISGAEWQWSSSTSKGGSYTTIDDAEAMTYSPTSDDVGDYLRATVTYADGHGPDKSATATSAHTVQAINLPNNPPVFPDQDPDDPGDQTDAATRVVEENTAAGEDVGAPVAAEDADDDILTYTLGGTAADDAFDIDQATGQIKTKADLDEDTTDSYTVTVTATDPAGVTDDTITVTITVTGVNEPPEITGEVGDYAENGTGDVAIFQTDDPENQTPAPTLDLSGADASLFDLNEGGVLTFKASPDYEMPGDTDKDNTYEVTVGAKDADGIRGTRDVEVKVTNVNEDGTVTLSTIQPRVGVSLTASLTDIDGPVTAVKWQWSNSSGAIDDATSDTYTPTAATEGTLMAMATYTDPQGPEHTATGDSVNPVAADTRNKAPVFDDQDDETDGSQNTEAERTVAEDAAADASVFGGVVTATDPNDSDIVSYTLGGPDASFFDIGLTSGQIMVGAGTKLDYETKTSYMVTVIATDSFGATASIDVTITVTAVNEGPEITGSAQEEYPENGEGAVATYTATDPELAGAIAWSLADSGDDEAFEIDKASGVLTFAEVPDYEMAADDDTNNEYTVTVVATDADGMTTEKVVTVTVTNVDEAGTVTLSAVAPYPGVDLTAMHSDLDDGIAGAEWQWSKSRSKSGSYNAIEEDAEAATYSPVSDDVGFYLRATVTYTDGHGLDKSAMATSAHTVQSINEPNNPPVFPDQDSEMPGDQSDTATRMVEENTAAGEDVGAPFGAEDSDDDILTYTLDTAAAVTFDIGQATGQIRTKADLDADDVASYTVTVTATDPAGVTDSIMVTITVTGVNEPPDITGDVEDYDENGTADVADFTATDPEGAGTVTLDLSGADASLFDLSTNGVLTFNDSPNYEMPGDADGDNTYEVTVGAKDADGIRGTRDVEVKVANVNEDGTVTLSAVQPRVGLSLTASLTDIDGPVTAVKWQWSNSSGDIEDATSDTYTPTAANEGTLMATATYTDPQGPDTAEGGSVNPVAVDTRNKAPMFAADQDADTDGEQAEAARTVAEDAAADASVFGGVVTATDPNDGDILTYTLGGPDASSFDIDASGQITVGAGTMLDYETKTSYMVTVIATDSFGVSDSVDVTITVTDVNEGPVIMRGGLAISGRGNVEYPENGTGAVATYTASGPDAASATWTLGGDDAGDFEISSSGELTFMRAPDYENAADANMNNTYMVTVKAYDGTEMATHDVTVRVKDVDEAIVGDPLLAKYDNNPQNDRIDREEVLDGIEAFFLNISPALREEVLDLIERFFADLGS